MRLRRGRLLWDTLEGASHSVDTRNVSLARDHWPYVDYLKYSYRADVKPKIDPATNYNITIELWIEPMLNGGALVFRGAFWRVSVKGGAWTNRLQNEAAGTVRGNFDQLGEEMMKKLRNLPGGITLDQFLNNNRRLIFSHPCVYDVQRVGTPDHTYTAAQIANICDWTTPAHAVAPGIRLLK